MATNTEIFHPEGTVYQYFVKVLFYVGSICFFNFLCGRVAI